MELPYRISVYTNLGRNQRDKDPRAAWNQMYGITLNRVWHTGIRADFHHSQFDGSFGRGAYQALSLSREFGDRLRFEVQGGKQNLSSSFTQQNNTRWINTSADWFLSTHFIFGGGFTAYRGPVQNYDQVFLNLGYRF